MVWELVEPFKRIGWKMGEITVRSVKTSFIVPESLVGRGFNWYYDKETGIAKIQIEDKSIRKLKHAVSLPKKLSEQFGDEQAICFYDENAIYFGTYKAGQKKFMQFLKQHKVV